MHIRRMTITLPARLRHLAEPEARRIAHAAAERLAPDAAGRIAVTLSGEGAAGPRLAGMVGQAIGARGGKP